MLRVIDTLASIMIAVETIAFTIKHTVVRQHSRYVHSGRTANVEFPRILAASVHTPYRCCIILRNCLKASRDNITDRPMICMLNIYPCLTVKISARKEWTVWRI
ncbi:hypothetical protein T03_17564 [Trichinella britovi]|uniref:Uncharacterized protein n=1 Tax=Trichinella britovi TaxID=45882 RepID=A0A0V1DIA9_TRIBR|nr:hypothetical protein T03_17564 [Trichinella britovi]